VSWIENYKNVKKSFSWWNEKCSNSFQTQWKGMNAVNVHHKGKDQGNLKDVEKKLSSLISIAKKLKC
jgi:hypothetical protein